MKLNQELINVLQAIIERIEGLVDWHADVEADVNDPSPEDSHAHCNGLVLQECKKARDILTNVKDRSPIGAVGESNRESNSAAPIG